MPNYKYKARAADGRLLDGNLEAENEKELAEKLTELNIVLVDAKPVKSVEMPAIHFGKIKRREIILFTNHLATSVEAGVSVVLAIADYARETEKPRFKKIVEDVERQVLAGTTLSESLSKHPEAFSELYTAIVSTGEATGSLDAVLRDLVSFLEWQEELTAHIRQASIYPGFLISMIIGVIVIMMTVTLPKFIPIFKDFSTQLPAPTRILIDISEFFQNYWYVLLLSIVLFVVLYKVSYRTPRGKYFWDNVKLKLPLFGKLHHKIVLSKFAHYFSMLYSSGIGVIESFNIIQRVAGNEVMRAAILRCRDSVEQGGTIFESLKQEETFPPLVLRMIQVGESTGKLDTSLQKVSQYYDREVPAAIARMFAVFEPMLIIVMGGVVLFIALAIFMPIYKLTSTIGGQR
ncbi:MAG: type II secretion system F family protein [bacterium]|nr:type II secretion system F family protein [bacterium]